MTTTNSKFDFIEVTEGNKTYIVYNVNNTTEANAIVRRYSREVKSAKNKKERDYLIKDWANVIVVK